MMLEHGETYHRELHEKRSRSLLTIAPIVLSGLLMVTGFVLEYHTGRSLSSDLLFLSAMIVAGYRIAYEGLRGLLRVQIGISLLITIAAVGATAIGHLEEGAAVLVLFKIAECLEEYAGERAKRSIEAMMELKPEKAIVKRGAMEKEVPVGEVEVGETVVLRPGDRVPLDGAVEEGSSHVDQASITGESVPVFKGVTDQVFAGTLNEEGFLLVRVTKPAGETLLSKIISLVMEAELRRSPTERFIDRFSRYYTPTVIVLSSLVATVPPLFQQPWVDWVYRALIFLVLSCPCALAISTPVAMVSAITSAARNGVLIKGSVYIEEVSKIGVFAFDKTGTLTEGKLDVVDVISLAGHSKEDILLKAASLEALSEHPIANAIVEKSRREGVELRRVDNFTSIAGKGIRGEIGGEVYHIGNERMFRELPIEAPEEQIVDLEHEGKTVILVGNEKEAIGIITVMDKLRDATIESIDGLKKMGIRTEMMTGDNERTARAIARRIGVDEYHADLLPDDKVTLIGEHLEKVYGHVAMVGDGVNDAPALAKANVGIAMGAIGSDLSLETADIALMQDDISKLPYLIKLSKKTLEIVKENVLASVLVKGSLAIFVFPGLVTLWLAVAVGDMGLSLAVILNAMRLSLIKPSNIR